MIIYSGGFIHFQSTQSSVYLLLRNSRIKNILMRLKTMTDVMERKVKTTWYLMFSSTTTQRKPWWSGFLDYSWLFQLMAWFDALGKQLSASQVPAWCLNAFIKRLKTASMAQSCGIELPRHKSSLKWDTSTSLVDALRWKVYTLDSFTRFSQPNDSGPGCFNFAYQSASAVHLGHKEPLKVRKLSIAMCQVSK